MNPDWENEFNSEIDCSLFSNQKPITEKGENEATSDAGILMLLSIIKK